MSAEAKAGLYEQAPEWAAGMPMLHQSIGVELVGRSPLHGWHKAFGPPEESTDATNRGQLAHALLLGGRDIEPVPFSDWRTNAAKEQRDAARAAGKLPVLAAKLQEAVVLADLVRKQLAVRTPPIVLSGRSEVTAIWQAETVIFRPDSLVGEPRNIFCQGKLDHLIQYHFWKKSNREKLIGAEIYDFKFVRNAAKRACENCFIEYGYDIQHAAYVQAIETIYPGLAGRVKMQFIFIESDPPHAIRVMPLAGTMRASGQWRWERACRIWAECLEKYGVEKPWPAYADDGEPADCPIWALNAQIAEAQLMEGRIENI